MMKKSIAMVAAASLLAACGSEKKNDEARESGKILVMYYSQTGITRAVAQEFATLLGADTLAFDAEQPYNGTYDETIARCLKEMAEGTLPKLAGQVSVAEYDTIFLGFPVWFGTYAPPVKALLSEVDFAGKTVVPFCTFGSGGLESSVADLKEALPSAEVTEGYGVRAARLAKAPKEIARFLIEQGFIEGNIEPQPPYSALQPVSEAETEIFQAACGDYPMPIGTPVSAGSRTTAESTDYVFSVRSTDREGNEVEATVYITQENDAAPEFTKVVR